MFALVSSSSLGSWPQTQALYYGPGHRKGLEGAIAALVVVKDKPSQVYN